MSGCRSCSGDCAPANSLPIKPAEKLEKRESSGNPRYPHVFVGQQAIYSDDEAQLIVKVVADQCDEECDYFTIVPQRILKDPSRTYDPSEPVDISQHAGEKCWKLQALI